MNGKMERTFVTILFYLVISLIFFNLFSSLAHGQNYQPFRWNLEHIANKARWQLGPVLIYPRISFNNIGYDNNIYVMSEEDEPISDFTASISPQATAYLLFRNRLILSLTAHLEYIYYSKEERNRSLNRDYTPGLRLLLLHRLVLSGNYQYQKSKRRVTSEFDAPEWYETKSYSGSLFLETARNTSIGFSGSIRRISYEDVLVPGENLPLSRTLNRKEKGGRVEFYYSISSESLFFISGGYAEYNFESGESQEKNSYSYQLNSGIRFPIIGRVRGTLSLGYKKFIPRDEEREDYSGIVGNTALDFRLGRINFRLNYNRDIPFSYGSSIFYINSSYGLGMSFYLTQYLRLDYNFSYGGGIYPEPIVLSGGEGLQEEIKRKDIYRSHSAGFIIRIIKNTGLGLTINYWERESNYYNVNRNRLFVGGYLTYDF